MTQEELQSLVEEISLVTFRRPFRHQAVFNGRLKTTGGRYHLTDHHLDFNPTLFAQVDADTIAGVIKHELCHYHLHLSGQGYRHQDAAFKQLLKKTGGLRYAPRVEAVGKGHTLDYRWLYRCQACGQEYPRKRRLNTQRYRCSRCRGNLTFCGALDGK